MCTLIAFPRAKGTDLATPGQQRGAGLGLSLIRFVLSANLIDRLARGGGEDTAPYCFISGLILVSVADISNTPTLAVFTEIITEAVKTKMSAFN